MAQARGPLAWHAIGVVRRRSDQHGSDRRRGARHDRAGGTDMLWTIAIVLIVLWALGMVTSHAVGGFIHILLVLAVIVVLIRVIRGDRVL
jgi:hypothetical protein